MNKLLNCQRDLLFRRQSPQSILYHHTSQQENKLFGIARVDLAENSQPTSSAKPTNAFSLPSKKGNKQGFQAA